MLSVQNVYGLNSVNKINFGLNKHVGQYHRITIPIDSKEMLISADECLEAYNKGGMLLRIQDRKPAIAVFSKRSDEFIANLQMDSNLNINGNELNLYDLLENFTDQKVVSSFEETRVNRRGDATIYERYELEDGSIIDKNLYEAVRKLTEVKKYHRGNRLERDLNNSDIYKINISDYTILLGTQYRKYATNIIDNNGNVIGKTYRKDGSVSAVLMPGDGKAIHYNADGTVTDKGALAKLILLN